MKAKIEGHKYFEDSIYNDIVKFLKEMKQHALNFQESRCKMLVISDGLTTFFGTRQKDP